MRLLRYSVVATLAAIVLFALITPLFRGFKRMDVESNYSQITHVLVLALYSYAHDHGGKYPEGKSSTEVFQQLLDLGYLSDARFLYVGYLDMPGKIPAAGNVLQSENVCWDVTGGLDGASPDNMPMIFFTGYKVSYQPGAAAMLGDRSWSQWWCGLVGCKSFIAVGYYDGRGETLTALRNGDVPNFIPADFDAKGKTYRQLTP